MEQCLPLSVPVAGTFLHVPCSSYECRASKLYRSMCRRGVVAGSDRCGGPVSRCRCCSRLRGGSLMTESLRARCGRGRRKGRGGFKTRVGKVLARPHGCTERWFFWGERSICRRRRSREGGVRAVQDQGAAKISLPASLRGGPWSRPALVVRQKERWRVWSGDSGFNDSGSEYSAVPGQGVCVCV
jgi:hypothetical protein